MSGWMLDIDDIVCVLPSCGCIDGEEVEVPVRPGGG